MKIETGSIVENKLSNGQVIVCRVMGFIESVQMFRLTDAREARLDSWLIENNRTWAAPIENIGPHDSDCVVCHQDGLITMGAAL